MQHFMKIFQKKHGKDLQWADEAETQGANMSQELHPHDKPFFETEDLQVFERLYLVALEM